jgi:hypothetical protein
MNLPLCLITLLSVTPMFAMDNDQKQAIIAKTLALTKTMTAADIAQKNELAQKNLAAFSTEIAAEENAFWSQSIDQMEAQLAKK